MRLFDAHNHLQDVQFNNNQHQIMSDCKDSGLIKMVTNGTSELDWEAVSTLAKRYPQIIPSCRRQQTQSIE